MNIFKAYKYSYPYVRPFWSKRLWQKRPTTSIRQKLRLRRFQKRMPQWCIADLNRIRDFRAKPRRKTYAGRFTDPDCIRQMQRFTI